MMSYEKQVRVTCELQVYEFDEAGDVSVTRDAEPEDLKALGYVKREAVNAEKPLRGVGSDALHATLREVCGCAETCGGDDNTPTAYIGCIAGVERYRACCEALGIKPQSIALDEESDDDDEPESNEIPF